MPASIPKRQRIRNILVFIFISYDYAYKVAKELNDKDIRAIVDDRNEKIGKKIRDNELKRIPYLLIVGEKEAENNEISVRKQGEGDKGSMKIITFAQNLAEEVEKMINQ